MSLSVLKRLVKIRNAWRSPDDTLDFLAQAPELDQSAEMQLMQVTARTRKNLLTLPKLPLKYANVILWHRGRSKTRAVLSSLDAGLPRDPLRELPANQVAFKGIKRALGQDALKNAQKWGCGINGEQASHQHVVDSQALIGKRYCQYVKALTLSLIHI